MAGMDTSIIERETFALQRLSITEDTYIASAFNSYVVRLKKAEALRIEDGDLLVSDGPRYRTAWIAMRMWSEDAVHPASERDRVTWYMPRGSSEYKVVDELPKFEPEP